MTRVALYARYSSDLQNERSADDQLAALRRAAADRGLVVVREFADLGVSGAALATRPGVQALMREAAAGGFDVVLTEALDRLSRGQADIARLFEMLGFYDVRLETLSSGQVSELHVGLEGTMNRMFLVELAKKTRRGLEARVRAGFSGGGRCYGYRIVERGVLEIEPAEAAVVRRVFEAYARGDSPRTIAGRLNAEGLPGPRGGEWTASAINGDRRAQDGMLHNALYVGVRVFNRRRYRKHPVTGRRSSVLNPPELWIREPAAHLRILDDDLWRKVQDRKAALSAAPRACARQPRRLLSGLLRCGLCGGGMTLGGGKYVCSAHRERGTCGNRKIIAAAAVERRVIAGVRKHLLQPEIVERAIRAFHDEMAADEKELIARRATAERALAEVKRRAARLVDQVAEGMLSGLSVRDRLTDLEAQRADLEAQLAGLAAPRPVRLHPNAAPAYRQLVADMHAALEHPDGEEVVMALRQLIDRVDFHPREGKGAYDLQVAGRLAALLAPQTPKAPQAMTACGVLMGAGTGFEPVTFRL